MNAEPAFPAQVLEEGGETRLAGRLAATRSSRQHQLQHRLKYGGRSLKFIWAPCHVTCTAVLIG